MPDDVINPAGTEIANGPPANQPQPDDAKESVVELGEDDLKNAGVEPQPEAEAGKEKPKAAAEEPAADDRPKPKTKPRRSDARVERVTAEAARLREANERMAAEMAELRQRVVVTDHAALDHFENATKAELEAAKRDLVSAKTANDPEKEAEAQERLATAAAKKAQIDTYRQANPKPDPKTPPRADQPRQPANQPAEDPAERLVPETRDWIESTGWFNPQSDDFDEDMHKEARNFANLLEGKWQRAGKGHLIGRDPEYFKAIEDHVREEFPDRFEEEQPPAERKQPQMSRPKAPVAGVGGAAAPGAAPSGKMQVRLSADEVAMAKNLWTSGDMKFPAGHKRAGQKPANIEEAKLVFALSKMKNPARAQA